MKILKISLFDTPSSQIKGVVKDSISGQPIPYVNIAEMKCGKHKLKKTEHLL
jgi:hypothetical protein